MKKRVISLIMAILIITALITACSEADDEIQIAEPTIAVTTTPEPTPEPPTPTPEPTPEPRNPEWTDDFDPVTGWDMMEKLGAGFLPTGTTAAGPAPLNPFYDPEWCESVNYGTYELSAGQELIEEWHVQAIAQKGFNSIYIDIPVKPYLDENYIIRESWLDRIQQIVDWSINAELNVVLCAVLDDELRYMIRDVVINGRDYNDVREFVCATWLQIAEKFKNHPEQLALRFLPEPSLQADYWEGDYSWWIGEGDGKVSIRFCDTINRLNADTLNTIRTSGGNNDKRVCILSVPGSDTMALPYMQPPEDDYIMYGIFGDLWTIVEDHKWEIITDTLGKGIPIAYLHIELTIGYEAYEEMLGTDNPPDVVTGILGRSAEMGIPSNYWNDAPNFWGIDSPFIPIFNMTTGEWLNEDVLNAYLGLYGIEPGPDFDLDDIPVPEFPYEYRDPALRTDEYNWYFYPPASVKAYATQMVVEFEGDLHAYGFYLTSFAEWIGFHEDDERITVEDERLVFDLDGLMPSNLDFGVWSEWTGDYKITRIYIDGPRDP